MIYRIHLLKQENDGYVATALDWPHCRVTAGTRELALKEIESTITGFLAAGEVVDLAIPATREFAAQLDARDSIAVTRPRQFRPTGSLTKQLLGSLGRAQPGELDQEDDIYAQLFEP